MSTFESNSTTSVKSDLTFPSSITHRVSKLDIANVASSLPEWPSRPTVSADDLISRIDRVNKTIAECIQLSENALRHSNDSDRVPFGLCNAGAVYSDQIRVPVANLCTADLKQSATG